MWVTAMSSSCSRYSHQGQVRLRILGQHMRLHLELLAVLVEAVANALTEGEDLLIGLSLILPPGRDASLIGLSLRQARLLAGVCKALVHPIPKTLLDVPGVSTDELLYLHLPLQENLEVVLPIIDHVVELKESQDLVIDFLQAI